MRWLRVLFLPLAFIPLNAADPLQATLAKLDEAALTFKGLTADMRTVAYTAVLNESQVQTGALVVKRPSPKNLRALFDIKHPAPQRIAYSGRTAEIYYPQSNLVQAYDVDKKYGPMVNQYLLLGFGATSKELQEAYKIEYGGPETVSGLKTNRIVLTPKKPDTVLGLTKAELWIPEDTGIAIQQKIYMRKGGDYNLATYSNMKLSANIPDSAVALGAPKNAKREYPQR